MLCSTIIDAFMGQVNTGSRPKISPGREGWRIVHVLESLATGGAERMAVDLAAEQSSRGHDPRIYCISAEGRLAQEARQSGIGVTNFAKNPGISLRTVWAMVRQLRRDRPLVVHTHNPPAHYYGATAAFLARIPVVVNTRHSPVSSRPGYQERYFEYLLPLTSEVVFVSQHARQVVQSQWHWLSKSSTVILNGVYTHKFRARPARPGSRRPRFVFGTVGRLVPIKNHKLLIAAFADALEHCPGAQLRIVGDGPLRPVLMETIVQLGLGGSVSIDPPSFDVPSVLSEFDVFVVSSDSEGLPLVVLEAMAAGLPVISTRVGGIPEVVPEGGVGWFCPPLDREALALNLVKAYQGSDLAERGRAASEDAARMFDVRHMADSYERLLDRLMAECGVI